MKITRYRVEVDQEKCIGYEECGLCIKACEENILIPDPETKKVKVNKEKEIYCDGIGTCLDVCPVNAIKITKEEIEVNEHQHSGHKCPGSMAMTLKRDRKPEKDDDVELSSELMNWPIQLHLLNPTAPYFKNAELLIAADCVPFAYANFHKKFLKGKVLAIGCPKLDDTSGYIEKIRAIVKLNNIKKVDVVIMSVPCCHGLYALVKKALEGIDCEIKKHVISIDGKVLE
ncbi:4Fe-4S ferredoxin iron-sulfur binding domain protein [Methanocaldococcus bathoardescens]|uniref:4Fe-4S ferredoxin iron-sulfur binding domain protein n=1 Tax=Methanocaldococcus bathoardescens TaxID=1301915 RepID=A0A076LC33_9EURY|nr:4Fe-4S dicluster domain-containing protein [Methanocaldococcus bathoardescens]AIJ05990.1 4Fe-4S ferredoxin iron-sulfur binding domain protein [Methanocaldococcus bathoardescens]